MKHSKVLTFRNVAAGIRAAKAYRKQMGIGLDGKRRRYGPNKKNRRAA